MILEYFINGGTRDIIFIDVYYGVSDYRKSTCDFFKNTGDVFFFLFFREHVFWHMPTLAVSILLIVELLKFPKTRSYFVYAKDQISMTFVVTFLKLCYISKIGDLCVVLVSKKNPFY